MYTHVSVSKCSVRDAWDQCFAMPRFQWKTIVWQISKVAVNSKKFVACWNPLVNLLTLFYHIIPPLFIFNLKKGHANAVPTYYFS